MTTDLKNTIIMAMAFLALFVLAELCYHKFGAKAEHTRKFVHAGTGLLTMLFPVLFEAVWPVLILCASFAVLLLLSLKYDLLKSINAIGRQSYGSISYPVSVFLSFLFFVNFKGPVVAGEKNYASFYLPVLVLAFADPAASLCGRMWPAGEYAIGNERKTAVGSSAFFLVSTIVSFLVLFFSDQYHGAAYILCAFVIGLVSTITEAVSRRGLDNLFIPVSVIASYYGFYLLS